MEQYVLEQGINILCLSLTLIREEELYMYNSQGGFQDFDYVYSYVMQLRSGKARVGISPDLLTLLYVILISERL